MGDGEGPCEVVGLACTVVGTESAKDEKVGLEVAMADGITETIGVMVEVDSMRGKPGADM